MSVTVILLLIAVVCFVIAAFQDRVGPVNMEAVGLAFFAGAFLVR